MQKPAFLSKGFGGIIALCIGDALGVPVEFMTRERLLQEPVVGYREYGTHNQPKGTFSDDASMTLCTVAALTESNIDWKCQISSEVVDKLCESIAQSFVKWYCHGFWSAWGVVFDVGGTTSDAIERIMCGEKTWLQSNQNVDSNGNGSLMRILPLAYVLQYQNLQTRFQIIQKISAITHAHIRSVIACHFYVEYAISLMKNKTHLEAHLEHTRTLLWDFYENSIYKNELTHFHRIFHGDITDGEIASDGYVVHTLEAALYCLHRSKNLEDALLLAVNLGEDTDTTAAVTGGLAGIYYDVCDLSQKEYFSSLAKIDEILLLVDKFYKKLERL